MAKLVFCGSTAVALLTAVCGCSQDEPESDPRRGQVHLAGTAFEDDCRNSGPNPDGTVRFVLTCPQSARSPDGKWILTQTGPDGEQGAYRLYVAGHDGSVIGDVPGLNDAMPFVLRWSPRSDWFAVDHHIGSFMDAPEVYEIRRSGIVKHDNFRHVAQAAAHRMFRCLPADREIWLAGSTFGWSRDGRKLAWAFTTRPDMCYSGQPPSPDSPNWKAFLMVSDVETGEIERGSIRILPDDAHFVDVELPTDGPYTGF